MVLGYFRHISIFMIDYFHLFNWGKNSFIVLRASSTVYFTSESLLIQVEFDHFVHRTLFREMSVRIAIVAIILILATVCFFSKS